jgi:membrane protein implicated in regulation of membrane protease activity
VLALLQYISAHHDQFFYVIAGLSFILELTVMGLGGPLLFFAIASFITGLLISSNLISGWEIEGFVLGISTAITAVLLWKPLKKLQDSGGGSDTSSDMIGRQVPTSSDITHHGGTIRYSGINWNSRLAEDCASDCIPEGELCIITSVDGNIMLVKPLKKTEVHNL